MIAEVEVRYGCTLSDTKKAAVVVRAGRKDYAAVITMTGTSVRVAHSRAATAKELTDQMYKQWRIAGNQAGEKGDRSRKAKDDDEEVETALSNVTCYGCGETGHKKAECPNKGRRTNKHKKGRGNGKGNCNHCGKPGHVEAKCWTKHPELKPDRNNGTSASSVEILVSNVECEFKFCLPCIEKETLNANDESSGIGTDLPFMTESEKCESEMNGSCTEEKSIEELTLTQCDISDAFEIRDLSEKGKGILRAIG